jgi:XRE family transcriptional regulator, regulator of sulfur utilization
MIFLCVITYRLATLALVRYNSQRFFTRIFFMADPKQYLSCALQQIRKDKGLSLDATAKLTGVSKAMLGQIERGESSPTVSTLWRIATGLEVSLTTFIEPAPASYPQATVIRTADDIRQHPADDGLHIAPLFPFEEALGFEYLELTFEAGYERRSKAHAPGIIEFITVIEGQLEVLSNKKWHPLNVGQTIRFAGDRPHGYRNLNNVDARVINIIHYQNR